MKLRNKKTGEITEANDWNIISEYNSLAELEREWEDYEEPKEYWYINSDSAIYATDCGKYPDSDLLREEIGNYFDTREEAEKAVEKLKAWKLLKDECELKFDGIIRDDKAMLKGVKLSYDRHTVTFDRMRECMDALRLLFGGKE